MRRLPKRIALKPAPGGFKCSALPKPEQALKTTRIQGDASMITSELPLVEQILSDWQLALAQDYRAYRNHVYRVIHFTRLFTPVDETQDQQLQIAASFHDLRSEERRVGKDRECWWPAE